MKIIGAGLSKTGTTSLQKALELLGFSGIHYDQERLNDILDGSNKNPDFQRYDDVDFVTDLPSAHFFDELLAAYPESKVILTIRELESWWKSVDHHWKRKYPMEKKSIARELARTILRRNSQIRQARNEHDAFRRQLRNYVYGSVEASEFLYKKKYLDHNERVRAVVPADRLLVMNIVAGDGWEVLCPFLQMKVPETTFPHSHLSRY